MGKLAVVFPGQGAQYVGMGESVFKAYPLSKQIFNVGSESLGKDLAEMCFRGSEETLRQTENTQPTILTTSIAIYKALEEEGLKADGFAGLSLGEYSALVAANALKYEDAVRIVRERGKFMQEEVPAGKGAMAAILGVDREVIEQVCLELKDQGICEVANYNCPQQIVIAGEAKLVTTAIELLKERGAKKAVLLPVSAPFHTKMLLGAGRKLGEVLKQYDVKLPEKPVYTNVTANAYDSGIDIRSNLVKQVSESVLWEDCVRQMIADGFDTFVEVGPGNALGKFIKKISKEVKIYNVESAEDVKALAGELGGNQ